MIDITQCPETASYGISQLMADHLASPPIHATDSTWVSITYVTELKAGKPEKLLLPTQDRRLVQVICKCEDIAQFCHEHGAYFLPQDIAVSFLYCCLSDASSPLFMDFLCSFSLWIICKSRISTFRDFGGPQAFQTHLWG